MGVSFSGEDFASALAQGEDLSIVHCGDKIAALVRTQMTPKFFDDETLDDEAKQMVRTNRRALTFSDAVLQMNISLCKRYQLGFYSGSLSGQLRLEFKP